MEKLLDRWLLAALGCVCAILIGLNVQLMVSNTRQLFDHSSQVAHTHEVMAGIESILSLVKDAETGQRGYLLTGEVRYLEPYNASVVAINEQVERVRKLISDNPRQQARIAVVRERIANKLVLLAQNIALRRDRGLDAARRNELIDAGKAEMDALRAVFRDMVKEERDLLEERTQQAQRSYYWALVSGVLAGIAALAVMIAFIVLLQRHTNARSRAAAVIHNQRELLRVTLASIGDGIITTDVDGRVTYLNAISESLTGWKQIDAAGLPLETVFKIVNESTRGTADNPALRALREGMIVGLANHTLLIARDGTERMIDDSASPIRDEQNNIVGCVLVFRDVSDRRAAERRVHERVEELAEGDRRKDEFLATLAHELRNPLAPLSNAIAILGIAGDDPQLFRKTRDMMERQLNQMVRLIDDLLDVSRISRGKLDLRIERVELAAVIRQAVETCRPLAEAAGHEVTVTLPQQPVYLDADPVRLAQVFSNLLSNSCKFTPRGGHITLSAVARGDEVAVSVRDDGIGIPADKLSEVFEMFAQVDHSLERSHGGLGIGLTLVRRLVGLHSGTVVASSEGPGRGSVFTVRLPFASSSPGGEAPAPVSRPAPEHAASVLVVDDNEDSAETLSMLLKLDGHEVRTAHDGAQAVEVAAAFRPDVVFLDIGLPKLNGYEAARKIRELPWSRSLVLVALTGWGQEEDRRKSREAGFQHHLVKPVDPAEALKIVASLARRERPT